MCSRIRTGRSCSCTQNSRCSTNRYAASCACTPCWRHRRRCDVAADRVRGVATSGWRGRSFSLGVADAATVLAASASVADAAATLIANAVDLPGHPAIRRTSARDLDPQSDLDERRVTVAVGPLTLDETEHALASGAAEAELWRELGLIEAAALRLGERTRLVGAPTSRYLGRTPAVARNEEKARHAVG